MIVTVSGEIGAGKSTVARRLAAALGLRYFSGGDVLREEARRRGMTLDALCRLAEQDSSIDTSLDRMQVEAVRAGNILVDSRLGGWLLDGDLRIWLRAPRDVRIARIAERDHVAAAAAAEEMAAREASERRRYRDIYQIDLENLTRYHIVVDTAIWRAEDIVQALLAFARALPDRSSPQATAQGGGGRGMPQAGRP